MRLREPLDDTFATGSHVRVLRVLDALPRIAAVSGREVARRAGVSQPTARDVLTSLERQGLVRVERSLRRHGDRLNEDHTPAPTIRELSAKARRVRPDVERSV